MIEVFDTRLMKPELFQEFVCLPYQFSRTDAPPTPDQPNVDLGGMYWTHQFYNFTPIDNPDYFQNAGIDGSNNNLYLDVLTYLEAVCPKMPPRAHLYSSYVNVLRHGNSPGIHVDSPHHVESNKTVLVYLNDVWHPEWGGETVFFDHNLDAVHLVAPRPGRVVIFDGRIPHTGRTPTPKFMYNRYILAYKYMDPDVRQSLFTEHEINNVPPIQNTGVAGFDPVTVKNIMKTIDKPRRHDIVK